MRAAIVASWHDGGFELVVSDRLMDKLARACAYPKLRRRIPARDAEEFIELLSTAAMVGSDPAKPARLSADPADDYLLALAAAERALLVSGDRHLLALAGRFPVHDPADFLALLRASG